MLNGGESWYAKVGRYIYNAVSGVYVRKGDGEWGVANRFESTVSSVYVHTRM